MHRAQLDKKHEYAEYTRHGNVRNTVESVLLLL